ncbi:hypothetical protein U732_154 [Clostridium argentinense CDC 2741]|uniref:DUF4153 domain-containing protein n=1 Tax=Clostridium argentinense CDC 2741 TaxID=1418104 RepID=A0A0C1UBX5_9CLOT|nr:DUF4153 domain-containing protein [Clostridium argentinense]ARC86293.1 DUF4153 domain-containing protein [Clostridium argentinense]KIE45045.1 hypothetical protein U732_154 [Clostridium argentinense CDC 2741]NFF40647.1 DUF4153 domain-containing protein [Clostridium argentinense]NFP51115.1 DUF4153 domain-containing protein [Clostridium argentinense]NFP73287.1 DUF4153 domain-containing protein [Clostridium argentinense]
MKFKEFAKNISSGIKNSIKRFPVSIALSLCCAILLIYISELGYDANPDIRENLMKLVRIFALGIPLSLCIKLFFERLEEYKRITIFLTYIGGAILLILYYLFLLNDFKMVSMTRYFSVTLILYLTFLFIPYISKKDNFELYVIKVFTSFFTTFIYSIVLYLGLCAILFTVNKLLGINVEYQIYYYTWLIVSLVFAPCFFLAGVPYKNRAFTLKDYPKLLKILILYIIIPLITIYTAILYIYFIKIIITWKWPQGLVSHLVLWYSVITAAVLFFIYPFIENNSWAKTLMKVFPKVLIPLIVMMFFSIGIRISAYGVTENRYYVVILGLWVFLIMLYFSICKKFKNIILPMSLAIIILISTFGPFSSYSISKYSQNKRFTNILNKNSMISEGEIIPNSNISTEDKNQISSILSYFNNKHSLSDVKYLPKNFKIQDIDSVFGFSYIENEYNSLIYYTYFNNYEDRIPLEIKDYDYLIDSEILNTNNSSANELNAEFIPESGIVKITRSGDELYSKDLNEFTKKLIDKYGINNGGQGIDLKEMTFEDENEKIKVKFLFSQISGSKDSSTGKIESHGNDFYILLKLK